jgi:hypothetical protein
MELEPYVENLRRQMAVAASAGGEEVISLAQRLTAALESTVRLVLLEALSAATAEITGELAPGSVELRLRGGDPEFVVTMPPSQPAAGEAGRAESDRGLETAAAAVTGVEGVTARINLRLPDQLKSQVEQSADREGLSINSWLVRAVAAAVDRGQQGAEHDLRDQRLGQRYKGWGR